MSKTKNLCIRSKNINMDSKLNFYVCLKSNLNVTYASVVPTRILSDYTRNRYNQWFLTPLNDYVYRL